ncbi:MAG: hypothetical protein COA69_07760 [Robiginitomaculum sp.]|nr:MAG: hypothetical protein COA69_07760 [Robiginitomaculum sp.]
MTSIADMSEQERQSWMTLLADICVFSVFWSQMVRGKSIESLSPGDLMGVYIGIIVMTIILHIIIASIFALRSPKDDNAKDERDVEIERKGARNAFWVVSILINIIIAVLLAENSVGEGYLGPNMGLLSVLSPSHMFFALMSTAFIGDIVYRATMVWAYRG